MVFSRAETFNRNLLPEPDRPEMDQFSSVSDMAILPDGSLLLIPVGIGSDAPQYMDPDQDGDQNILHVPTEVRQSDRADQSDRAVYRLDPRTSGMDLRPNPRPDDGTDRTA